MVRYFTRIVVLSAMLCTVTSLSAQNHLPVGSQRPPVSFPHFPDRLHAVVWRNWQLVAAARMAQVVGTTEDRIQAIAASMGLPPAGAIPPEWRRRGYITIVRRNWHLLPYEQLLGLIDMDEEEFAAALYEDDFLFVKLGSSKPLCPPVRYVQPGREARDRAAQIKQLVAQHFGDIQNQPDEPPFHFVHSLSRPVTLSRPRTARSASGGVGRPAPSAGRPATPQHAKDTPSEQPDDMGPRFLYSYFGAYGDPLADPQLDPYPDGLLERLADCGVNGVWLHIVLRQMAPGADVFPEFGDGWQQRLENLRRLVARAERHGIRVYLYLNEPRAMPARYFASCPELAGVAEGDLRAMCTSEPRVRQWLQRAVHHVFSQVPDLGGVFTITASENLTHCASHGNHRACPRCQVRSDDEIIAEVNTVIADAVHSANPQARVIAWDWGWKGHAEAPGIIALLPKSVYLMSVSEWAQRIERGGVVTTVGEYTLSAPGPGPRAQRQWELARERGLKTLAKVQLNNSWELSAVPYLPVMDLVAQHCANLAKHRIDGMMLSWSLGGYPSLNLRVAQMFAARPEATIAEVLDRLAVERYGPAGQPLARRAWTRFSRGFAEFPFHGTVVYRGPQQLGPANLLFREPTGYAATMVGFPYDDLDGWRGPYPADVFVDQIERLTDEWKAGVELLEQAAANAPAELRQQADGDVRIAQAAYCHFASVANQARFVQTRSLLDQADAPAATRARARQHMLRLLDQEIQLAKTLFTLARADSRIGFEASNHYYYVPLDLVEKVINCQHLLDALSRGVESHERAGAE